jgi:hypothetical protein
MLRTGGNILTDITENKATDVRTGNIVSKHVTESRQNFNYVTWKRSQKYRHHHIVKQTEKSMLRKIDIF